jgi:hypothetical protein
MRADEREVKPMAKKAISKSIDHFVIGWRASESISRVEDLNLTDSMRDAFVSFDALGLTADQRRKTLLKTFGSVNS